MAIQPDTPPAVRAGSHRQEVFSTLLKWSTGICASVALVQTSTYVYSPVWTLIILILGFVLLSFVSWWGIGQVRGGKLEVVVNLYLATAIAVMGAVVVVTDMTLLLEAAMGLMIFVLLATFLETEKRLTGWVIISSVTYIGALIARELLSLPQIDYGPFLPVFLFTIPPTLLVLTALLGRIMSQHLQRALARSEASTETLRQSYEQLETRSHELLEQRRELEQALAELRASTEERRELARTVEGLSTPILPVLERVLVMPLIGLVDEQRAQHLQSSLLQAIQQQRARVVILDVTGLTTVDTFVLRALLSAVQGSRLLGAQPIIVGISPEVAEIIVQLGVPHHSFLAMSNLQAALSFAIKAAA